MRRTGWVLVMIAMAAQVVAAADKGSELQNTNAAAPALPSIEETLAARTDLLGDLARRQPDGPSYEFFAKAMPPLRYMQAPFMHYIIALSAPHEPKKGRVISNGSGINLRYNAPTLPDYACSVAFNVGEVGKEEKFGGDLPRLDGPRYQEGYLPIVEWNYRVGASTYSQQAFACVESPLKETVTIMAQFTLRDGPSGRVIATIPEANLAVERDGHLIRRADDGKALLWLDEHWTWDATQKCLTADLVPGRQVFLAVFTHALETPPVKTLTSDKYREQQAKCAATWSDLIKQSALFQVPEARVNNAWRALLIGNCMAQFSNTQAYSASDYYEQEHVIGCGDPVRAQLLYGFQPERVKPLLRSLLRCYAGPRVEDCAEHLHLVNQYYHVTRDAEFVRETVPHWTADIWEIWSQRDAATGLPPKERYNYDMAEPSFTLHSSANFWRRVRDLGKILDEIGPIKVGETTWDGARLAKIAAELHKSLLAAVEKSEVRDSKPPFMPLALLDPTQKGFDPLTATMAGSYWTIIVPYLLGTDLFAGSERENWILDYLHTRGGVCMGMMRFDNHSKDTSVNGLSCTKGLDDGFTTRYAFTLLRRDKPEDVERAIVSFYGKLAQGMTWDTFISPEPSGLMPMNDGNTNNPGRPMFAPPITYANAFFQHLLRYLLIQDFDLDSDGKPETLRLAFATPRPWLRDGATIRIERAPSAFGEVSLKMKSNLKGGEVIAEVGPLARLPQRVLLRARVPEGWKVVGAKIGRAKLAVDERGTVEIPPAADGSRKGATVRFQVKRQVAQEGR